MSTPQRWDQISSWSAAAARKVSAAAMSTRRPSPFRWAESLPMVVVLPTPFTPMKRATDGLVSSLREMSPTSKNSVRMARRHSRPSPAFLIFSALARRRSSSTAFMAVSTPMSERMRVSSSSS